MKTTPPAIRRLCLALVMSMTAPWASGQLVQTLKDINTTPVGASTEPDEMTLAGGNLFISTDNALTGTELWKYTVLAAFNGARGVVADTAGNVFVADTANHVIRKITPSGMVSTLAGTVGVPGLINGAGMAAKFSSPSSITIVNSGPSAGIMFVADTGNHIIRRVTPEGLVTTLAGNVNTSSQVFVGQPGYIDNNIAGDARFRSPRGIAARALTGSNVEVYVSDSGNHAIRRIQILVNATTVSTLAGASPTGGAPGTGTPGFQDGTGSAARFNNPGGIALNNYFDGSGNLSLFLADTGNNRIRRVSLGGSVTNVAGSGLVGAAPGTGLEASFNAPEGITCDAATAAASANVYVADTGNHLIRRIQPGLGGANLGIATTFAGSGAAGSSNGLGVAASFNAPMGLGLRGTEVFVADTNNHIIRSIVAQGTAGAGTVSLRAGQVGVPGSIDGSATGTATPTPVQLKDIMPGVDNSEPRDLTVVGTDVFFSARSGDTINSNRDLWKSDGTSAGTIKVGNTDFPINVDGPQLLTTVGETLYFQGYNPAEGAELWQWRKAANPALNPQGIIERVTDINPGVGSSLLENLFAVDSTHVVFGADNSTTGVELWKSNLVGTNHTTTLVADLFSDSVGSNPSDFTLFNGKLYFVATSDVVVDSTTVGRELFQVDPVGLTATVPLSTMLVDDLDTLGDSEPRDLTISGAAAPTPGQTFSSQMFFSASASDSGRELYVMNSDNSYLPTLVVDLNSSLQDSNIDNITPLTFTLNNAPRPNCVVFTAEATSVLGNELYISDGTVIGTTLVRDISEGEDDSELHNFFPLSPGVVVFTKTEADNKITLWRTDGTQNGTVSIENFTGEGEGGDSLTATDFRAPVVVGTNLYFMMSNDELWRTNGQSDAGTVLVHRFRTSTESSNSQKFTRLSTGNVVFSATTPGDGAKPWFTNLNDVTIPIPITQPAGGMETVQGTDPDSFAATADGRVFFSADVSGGNRELFVSDGATAERVVEISPFGSANPQSLLWRQDQKKLYFSAQDTEPNNELWVLTSVLGQPSTVKKIEVNSSGNGSFPKGFIAYKNFVYFSAETQNSGVEIWRTDGDTLEDDVPFKEIFAGQPSSDPDEFVVMPAPTVNANGELVFAGNAKLYFVATGFGLSTELNTGRELWVTDGSAANTKCVKDILPGGLASMDPSKLSYLTVVGNTLYFVADDDVNGRELWKSDGTVAGTVMVKDINIKPDGTGKTMGSDPTELRNVNGKLFFLANDGDNGRELYTSTGTAAGTTMVSTGTRTGLVTGPNDAGIESLTVIKDVLSFTADDGVVGREIWISDGTKTGTNVLTEFVPGPGSSYPHNLAAADDKLIFSASDVLIGDEPRVCELSSKLIVKQVIPQPTPNPPTLVPLESNTSVLDFTPETALAFGSSKKITLRLSNEEGTTGVTNVVASVSGPHAADFKVTKPASVIPRGQFIDMTIEFKPLQGGERNATLLISSTDSLNAQYVIQLSGDCSKDPTVATHPITQMVKVGAPVTMSSTISVGTAPVTLQWKKNNAAVAGATLNPLYLWAAKLTDGGAYTAVFTSATKGTGTSDVAQLGVVEDFMPARVLPVAIGNKATTLTVNATGNGLTYLWKRSANADLSNPEDLTAPFVDTMKKTLVFTKVNPGLQPADTGYYFCQVTGPGGTVIGGTTHVKVFASAPAFIPITNLPVGIVGSPYFHQVLVDQDILKTPTTFSAAKLPAGLAINAKTGVISGIPTAPTLNAQKQPISVTAVLTVTNKTGTIGGAVSQNVSISIVNPPTGLEGIYQGLVDRNDEINGSAGGRIEITVTTKASYSGKLILGPTTYPFKGNLEFTLNAGQAAAPYTAMVRIPRTGISAPLDLSFTIEETNKKHLSAGNIASVNVSGPVNAEVYAWKALAIADLAPYRFDPIATNTNAYNFGMRLPAMVNAVANPNIGNMDVPQGTGYGSFTIAKTGALTIAGMTADGEKITCATFIGPNGEVLLYQSLYTTVRKGSVWGLLMISTAGNSDPKDNVVSANSEFPFDWTRPPATLVQGTAVNTRTYRAGFGLTGTPVANPVELEAFGGYYQPATNLLQVVTASLPSGPMANADKANLTFTGAGLSLGLPVPPNPNATHVAVSTTAKVMPMVNPAKTKFATSVLKTGLFTGSFYLENDDPTTTAPTTLDKPTEVKRTVPFLGLIVPEGGIHRGVGYFLLPQLPAGPTDLPSYAKGTTILSGVVNFVKDP
ncbi:MAG: ELWxxDGT repeat protein [Verrucomicrobiota bacterium]